MDISAFRKFLAANQENARFVITASVIGGVAIFVAKQLKDVKFSFAINNMGCD